MWANLQFPADLVTFTEEILNRKLNFLCSVWMNLQEYWKLVFGIEEEEQNNQEPESKIQDAKSNPILRVCI